MTVDGSLALLDLLKAALKAGASDVIVTAGSPPALRLQGQIRMLEGEPLSAERAKALVYGVLKPHQVARFEQERELDFSFTLEGRTRFRGNAFWQRGCVGAAFRVIPDEIPSLDSLNLPAVLEEFALAPQGLVLFTGPTGHGKSTSQAALIDLINTRRRAHIVTVEDPIEFVHRNRKSIIEQREVGEDTHSFGEALKHVLREAPDVILVGELRDAESIGAAVTAAETGHLVFGTLHTNDVVQAIDRIIDVFPSHQQPQIRGQLSMCLLAVISQRLLPRGDGAGRVPAVEILRNAPGVANLIREEKTHQLYSLMETQGKMGMRTMDSALKELYLKGLVTYEEAKMRMRLPAMLDRA